MDVRIEKNMEEHSTGFLFFPGSTELGGKNPFAIVFLINQSGVFTEGVLPYHTPEPFMLVADKCSKELTGR